MGFPLLLLAATFHARTTANGLRRPDPIPGQGDSARDLPGGCSCQRDPGRLPDSPPERRDCAGHDSLCVRQPGTVSDFGYRNLYRRCRSRAWPGQPTMSLWSRRYASAAGWHEPLSISACHLGVRHQRPRLGLSGFWTFASQIRAASIGERAAAFGKRLDRGRCCDRPSTNFFAQGPPSRMVTRKPAPTAAAKTRLSSCAFSPAECWKPGAGCRLGGLVCRDTPPGPGSLPTFKL